MSSGLEVALESPLPGPLPVGKGTALFCFGRCRHAQGAVDDLHVVVDGVRHRAAAFGMPRPDLGEAHSAFWATVPVPPHDRPATVELQVAARIGSTVEVFAPLGRLEVVEARRPPALQAVPEKGGLGLIAVCMATFEPDMTLFRRQIESLRAQTDRRWVCLISDDCSDPEHFRRLEQTVAGDPRFFVSRAATRRGFYRNFERALELVPAEADLVALCDQDDRWHPDKLEVLRTALGSAQLVYSDQRLVDRDGRVLRETFWKGRRNNPHNLASTLVANTITGAATLFRREICELALPFPDPPGLQFHDHWLALVATAAGEIAYVDRPLYDYVQHDGAVFGSVTRGGEAEQSPRRRWREVPEQWRAAYFCGYAAREVQAQAVLVRCAARLTPSKRRVLKRFIATARSPLAFAWLAARPARCLAGLTETLGSEADLARGILWKALMVTRSRHGRSIGRLRGDARVPSPETFSQKRLRRWRADIR